VKQPTVEQLEEWMEDGGCEATDGCWVEADEPDCKRLNKIGQKLKKRKGR